MECDSPRKREEMKNTDFEKLVRQFRLRQDELIISKGHDYTVGNGDEDRLWNFKTVAGLLGIHPMQALGVYWLKHILAICTYIKTGALKSEDIDGRFLDESNYNLLGRALIDDLLSNPLEEVYHPSGQTSKEEVSSVRRRKNAARDKTTRSKRKVLQGTGRKLRKP
jgi:hypothetical protein